jgi:radical SAM protein with 4Fe4S-binding SPASM domain
MTPLRHQVSRLDYLRRHIWTFLQYLSWRKACNIVRNLYEVKLKVAKPRSWPLYLKIEPTPLCHMRCPGCDHRDLAYKKQFTQAMRLSFDDFRRVIDPLSNVIVGISLSFRGEPLLNRQIARMAKYAHAKNIATSFPSNLAVPLDSAFAAELVDSGLDAIYVSLDGATDETYRKYRVGGDFRLVLKNVSLISQIKKTTGTRRPKLIWKFVVFPHNRHEIELVRNHYKGFGFDGFEFVEDYDSDEARKRQNRFNRKLIDNKSACFFLWSTMIITSQGDVRPCCKNSHEFGLGNVLRDGIRETWRSTTYSRLRMGFSTESFGEAMHGVCKSCIGLNSRENTKSPGAPSDLYRIAQ